ncbi:hypothetical protein CHU92_01155 [Flavobacterium cyanobacteriorum]|uniref:TonB-dependent receptor plug domain-containing protein n=1 Tax=Flavobacterium cyanobacteriorum TaxID=2022802 RepID=A0A256A0G3_9FLAO|nr:TonB-dependent receptor [Flavobacterium cyanobacteriorum]OYQ47172.1 hypothetical protein CHU92_01155 [Flavobacterium cyanobacteriorum]
MARLLLLLIIFVADSIYAQEKKVISGYITDAKSGEKLFGVSIFDSKGNTTTTNEYGYFSLPVEGETTQITISYTGYKNIVKEITGNNLRLDVALEQAVEELAEVVVTKKRNTVQSSEIGTATLKASVIKKLPAILGEPDVLKTIQLLPGVSSVNEASSGFNVRGGSADQNLVLLDDATIYNASHLFGFFSVFNPDAIKDVKLYKGGIPAYYGGRLSSVLDVRQKEGNKKEFNGEAGIGLISSRVLVEGPFAKRDSADARGSYMVAARRSYIDAFTFIDDEFKDTRLYFYDLNLKTNYELNAKNNLYLSGYFGRDRFKLPGLIGTTWGNATGTLRWTSILSDKLFLQTSAVYSNYDYELDNLRSGSEYTWKSRISNFNIKPRLTWYYNNDVTARAGLDILYYVFSPGEISPLNNSSVNSQTFSKKYSLENGAYVDTEYKISDKLLIQPGLRFSNFSRLGRETINQYNNGMPIFYNPVQDVYEENEVISGRNYKRGEIISRFNNLEPRLSFRYLLNENSSVKAGYNRMYQYIHLVTNTTSPTPLDVWTPSGPYIKPQSADQVGIGYYRSFLNNAYELSVESYYKRLYNVTDFKEGADLLFREDIETQLIQGTGRAYGVEVLLNKYEGNFTGWISYTLSKSETKITGINNSRYYPNNADQLHRLNIVGMYKLGERWEFGGIFSLSTGRPVTYPTGRYEQNGLVVADYNSRNGSRLPTYHRLDLSATLNPKPGSGKTGKWIFSLVNVYNRQNASSIYFREVSEVNDVEVATGRTEAVKLSFFGIVPSVTYEFKF